MGHMSPQELGESLAARSAGGNEDVQYVDVREVGARSACFIHFDQLAVGCSWVCSTWMCGRWVLFYCQQCA